MHVANTCKVTGIVPIRREVSINRRWQRVIQFRGTTVSHPTIQEIIGCWNCKKMQRNC